MSQNEWVAIRYVRALLSTELGREHAISFLKEAGIEEHAINDPFGHVSIDEYVRLLNSIWVKSRDESFGFTPSSLKPGSFAMMCHIMLGCERLSQALSRAGKFYQLLSDDFSFRLQEHSEGARFELEIKAPLKGAESFFTEAVFAVFLRLSAWMIDRTIQPLNISLCYPQSESFYSFEGKLTCPILYQKGRSSLDFPRKILNEPVRRNGVELQSLLIKGPQQFLVDFRSEASFSTRLKAHWNQHGESLTDSLEDLAASFGISPSSLRRKLRDEGCNFNELRENVRYQSSRYYLLYTHKSLESIAALMGYSEPSTFHRAFKKWTGMTPRDYRLKGQEAYRSSPNV